MGEHAPVGSLEAELEDAVVGDRQRDREDESASPAVERGDPARPSRASRPTLSETSAPVKSGAISQRAERVAAGGNSLLSPAIARVYAPHGRAVSDPMFAPFVRKPVRSERGTLGRCAR
jgi:hypothetical protein